MTLKNWARPLALLFNTVWGCLSCLMYYVMPFGLCNAPATFQLVSHCTTFQQHGNEDEDISCLDMEETNFIRMCLHNRAL